MLQALIAPTMKTTQSPVVSIIITSNKLQGVGLFRGEQAAGHLFSTSPWFGFEIGASMICRPQCQCQCMGVPRRVRGSHGIHTRATISTAQKQWRCNSATRLAHSQAKGLKEGGALACRVGHKGALKLAACIVEVHHVCWVKERPASKQSNLSPNLARPSQSAIQHRTNSISRPNRPRMQTKA